MGLGKAGNLFTQTLDIGAVGVGAGGREVGAVVDRIYRVERVGIREDVVQPDRSEIVTGRL